MRAAVAAIGLAMALDAPPAAALSRTYICFFESGSSALTESCKRILNELPEQLRRALASHEALLRLPREELSDESRRVLMSRAPQLNVEGAAQEESSEAANLNLAMQRTLAVAVELERLGVLENQITTRVIRRLLVPNDLLSPQNRFVEVVLR
jgi:hypothetical protein